VGRPDLHIGAAGAERRAKVLFRSLIQLRELGPEMVVLPSHASEPIPFDGQTVCARMKDLAAALFAWLASEPAFVERVTSRLPPTPPNFSRIVRLNEAGELPEGDPTDLEAGATAVPLRKPLKPASRVLR